MTDISANTNRETLPATSGSPLVFVALLTLLLVGCHSTPDYPPNLSFPSRTDRLVLKLPTTPPPSPSEAGNIVAELARLDAAGGKTLDPTTIPIASRNALDQSLRDLFGTPAAPSITVDAEANASAERLGLVPDKLTEGSRLFRKQCLQCHNLTGDGQGPAANVVPAPRDFRRGMFKFTTNGESKPRRADIMRTLSTGLKGSAMPSFGLLPEAERDLLARFATYLSIRGLTEFETLAALGAGEVPDVPAFAKARTKAILADWERAENAPPFAGLAAIPNDGEPESATHGEAVRRGYALFTAKADNSCITCHGDFGRKPVLRYDVWGTVVKPAELTERDIFKGGKQPEDVFARIRGGIAAVGMPAHPELTDRQVWDLVRFVQAIPYRARLPKDVEAV
ncbi:MAG: c-type cytochrome, partial [Planctomycetes bacterium]|nr:c-type cytochrome [Planctomycetota bacterium]